MVIKKLTLQKKRALKISKAVAYITTLTVVYGRINKN